MPSDRLLYGKIVRLDAVRREDVTRYPEWFANTEFTGNLWRGITLPLTIEDSLRWFEEDHRGEYNNSAPPDPAFAIRTLPDNVFIGFVALNGVDWKNLSSWVAIGIGDRAYWGKGCGTDAMRVMLRFAFTELGLNRVELGVFDFNRRAIASYQKVGFQIEGIQRQAIYRDGCFNDCVNMAILRAEWLALPDEQR